MRAIEARIERACARADRDPAEVSVVAVGKGQPAPLLARAVELGVRDLGENYVQELEAKARDLALANAVRWHLVGHLQGNKATRAAGLCQRLDSLDSLQLGQRLDRACLDRQPLAVLCQVDFTGLPSRSGYRPGALERDFPQLQALPGLSVQGLMTVAAPGRALEDFKACRELARRLEQQFGWALPALSMGMSGDFEEAILCGSTEVRIGTLLFGPRQSP